MSRRVFKNFQEFYFLTRPLSSLQRSKLMDSIPNQERKRLIKARSAEGWEDLFIRNEIDSLVDVIKEDFGEDLILLRIRILSGETKKVRKSFWKYITDIFSSYSLKDKWNVLEGIKIEPSGDEHYLLVSSREKHK